VYHRQGRGRGLSCRDVRGVAGVGAYCMPCAGLVRWSGGYFFRALNLLFAVIERVRQPCCLPPSSAAGACPFAVQEAAMFRRLLSIVVLGLAVSACVPYNSGYSVYRSEVYTVPTPYYYGVYHPYYVYPHPYYVPAPHYWGPSYGYHYGYGGGYGRGWGGR